MNYIVIDTETTNGFDDPLVYDCGWSIISDVGEVLNERSYVNADIFLDEKALMKEAFFADKIPQYWEDIKKGSRELKTFFNIRKAFAEDFRNYFVMGIIAHNARFDYNALQTTQRYITKSKYRWFFPYGSVIMDSLKMSKEVFGKDEDYIQFCIENGFTLANGKTPRYTAEILYRYLTNDIEFEESHTGLEDTKIEREIFLACLRKNPTVVKSMWA